MSQTGGQWYSGTSPFSITCPVCLYAECIYAECHYAECRGAIHKT